MPVKFQRSKVLCGSSEFFLNGSGGEEGSVLPQNLVGSSKMFPAKGKNMCSCSWPVALEDKKSSRKVAKISF